MSAVMSQKFDLKPRSLCGDPQCLGSSCDICEGLRQSIDSQARIECPHKVPSCIGDNQCDKCSDTKYPKSDRLQTRRGAVGGGSASDVVTLQGFHVKQQCSECKKTVGSNPRNCGICASFLESQLNPEQPDIWYDYDFGPVKGSFGPCTYASIKSTLEDLTLSFETSKKNGFPFTEIDDFKRNGSLLTKKIFEKTFLGVEGVNNSCYYVAVFWMLSQGNMHKRINTNCRSGHILYKILWDLRARLFVGRDIVEAFRRSLEEYNIVQRSSKSNFEQEMDDFGYLLSILEDDEFKILRKDSILSHTGCSFHVHESTEFKHASIQDALCASVSFPSPVPEDGSIISFQLCQQKGDKFTHQTLGTGFEFPHNGVILGGKLLRAKMFIIFKSKHYLVVLCVGESYFLANSLSASQCGHFLPEMTVLSEEEAMELFRTQAHTIVFECIGNAYAPPTQPPSEVARFFPPPHACASGHWVPPPPPPACRAQNGWFPPPSPPAPCAQYGWVSPPPASCAEVVRFLPPPQAACAQVSQVPEHKRSSITENDIVVSPGMWICSVDSEYSGIVEKTPHPNYPKTMMEVYFYQNVSHTTLDALVKFINFIKSIQ